MEVELFSFRLTDHSSNDYRGYKGHDVPTCLCAQGFPIEAKDVSVFNHCVIPLHTLREREVIILMYQSNRARQKMVDCR